MPKNGNRGANTKKSNLPFASNKEDINSNVVFGDARTKRKDKQGSTADESAKKGGAVVPVSSENVPKQPDTRKLVSYNRKSSDYCQDASKDMHFLRRRILSLKFLLASFSSTEVILTKGS